MHAQQRAHTDRERETGSRREGSEIFKKNKCNIQCTKWLHCQRAAEVWGAWWLFFFFVPLKPFIYKNRCIYIHHEPCRCYLHSTPIQRHAAKRGFTWWGWLLKFELLDVVFFFQTFLFVCRKCRGSAFTDRLQNLSSLITFIVNETAKTEGWWMNALGFAFAQALSVVRRLIVVSCEQRTSLLRSL